MNPITTLDDLARALSELNDLAADADPLTVMDVVLRRQSLATVSCQACPPSKPDHVEWTVSVAGVTARDRDVSTAIATVRRYLFPTERTAEPEPIDAGRRIGVLLPSEETCRNA